MKVSIITVVKNNEETILQTINSIKSQSYQNIEHIIIDGKSSDNTLKIIKYNHTKNHKILSEKDDGIFDAMNKGINLATGEIIGFLNGDDLFANENSIDDIVSVLKNTNIDACYGDLLYFKDKGGIVPSRYWKSREYKKGVFASGWAPAHPTFYVKKIILHRFGMFNLKYKLAADFELMMRLLEVNNIKVEYIPKLLIYMRLGGASNKNIKNIYTQNIEIINALKTHNLFKNIFYLLFCKIFVRVKQFINKNTVNI